MYSALKGLAPLPGKSTKVDADPDSISCAPPTPPSPPLPRGGGALSPLARGGQCAPPFSLLPPLARGGMGGCFGDPCSRTSASWIARRAKWPVLVVRRHSLE